MQVWLGAPTSHSLHCGIPFAPPCCKNSSDESGPKIGISAAALFNVAALPDSLVAINDFVLVALCLTFGGAPNPSQWSDISELTCDLTNNIVRDEGWDHQVLQSPHQATIGNTPELEVPDVPLAPASALAVTLPSNDVPKSDCDIDNLFAAFLECDFHWGSRIIATVCSPLGGMAYCSGQIIKMR